MPRAESALFSISPPSPFQILAGVLYCIMIGLLPSTTGYKAYLEEPVEWYPEEEDISQHLTESKHTVHYPVHQPLSIILLLFCFYCFDPEMNWVCCMKDVYLFFLNERNISKYQKIDLKAQLWIIFILSSLNVMKIPQLQGLHRYFFFSFRKLAHAIYGDFLALKFENFQLKNFDIFLIFAQNINCGYTLEPPR